MRERSPPVSSPDHALVDGPSRRSVERGARRPFRLVGVAAEAAQERPQQAEPQPLDVRHRAVEQHARLPQRRRRLRKATRPSSQRTEILSPGVVATTQTTACSPAAARPQRSSRIGNRQGRRSKKTRSRWPRPAMTRPPPGHSTSPVTSASGTSIVHDSRRPHSSRKGDRSSTLEWRGSKCSSPASPSVCQTRRSPWIDAGPKRSQSAPPSIRRTFAAPRRTRPSASNSSTVTRATAAPHRRIQPRETIRTPPSGRSVSMYHFSSRNALRPPRPTARSDPTRRARPPPPTRSRCEWRFRALRPS